jgi:hypothetical protein
MPYKAMSALRATTGRGLLDPRIGAGTMPAPREFDPSKGNVEIRMHAAISINHMLFMNSAFMQFVPAYRRHRAI